MVTWILAANGSRARVLETASSDEVPREIADFANAATRAHERDLRTDAAGRFFGRGEGASTGETSTDHPLEKFAVDLRDWLEHARTEQRFDRLWLVVAPALLGALRKALPNPLARMVELELDKDLTTESPREIARHAREAHDAR